MKLFVGLGNPGAKYAGNRHNIGFMAVDAIADAHGFGPWRNKFQALLSDGKLGSEKVVLVKPQTYMNKSGQAVGEAMRFYKIAPEDVVVFYDELDLAAGKCRVKQGGGTAGHNGIRSLHAHIGDNYHRVRLGIGHPGDKRLVQNHVLGDFSKADRNWLDPMLAGIADGARPLADDDPSRFMNAVAQRVVPSRPSTGDKGPSVAPKPATDRPEPEPAPDSRSALQKLVDRFSR